MTAAQPRRYRRSRLILLVWSDEWPVLVQADTLREFRVDARLFELLSQLGEWRTAEEISGAGMSLGEDDLAGLCDLGILESYGDAAASGEPWEPLELAVHRRTARVGVPLEGRAAPPLRRDEAGDRPRIPLPDPRPLEAGLERTLRTRRTLRSYAPRPLTLDALSTLLHHSAGVVHVARGSDIGDIVLRPFASAGARSELEIHVVANDVEGLNPGAWYYEPFAHALVRARDRDEHQTALNRRVNAATGDQLSHDPPAILLVTAVFERMTRKYGHLALSLVYKNVGCLVQNLYLVSTALGLAPCAIGGGNESANSRWLGLDPLRESQVGCFLVGPAADPPLGDAG